MKEFELLLALDEAFTNIDFALKKEVKYKMLRLDREATCGNTKYFIEAEGSSQRSFQNGIRQLLTLRSQLRHLRMENNVESSHLLIAVPDLTSKMQRTALDFGIRAVGSGGLRRISTYVMQEQITRSKEAGSSLSEFIVQLLRDITTMYSKRNDSGSRILSDIQRPDMVDLTNMNPLLRVMLWDEKCFNVRAYHGIKELTRIGRTPGGKRMRWVDTPEWEAFSSRIPAKDELEAMGRHGTHVDRLGLEAGLILGDSMPDVVERLGYVAFGLTDSVHLRVRVYELANPLSIAYGERH